MTDNKQIPDKFGEIVEAMRKITSRHGRTSEKAKKFLRHALKDLCAYDWEQVRLREMFGQLTLQDFGVET